MRDAAGLANHWLFLYARKFCGDHLSLDGCKIKGRNHQPRREIDPADPFLSLLPHAYVSKPKPGTIGALAHKRRKVGTRLGSCSIKHYDQLGQALLAVGYDLDQSRVVSPEAYAAASAYFRLQREPIPYDLARHNLPQAEVSFSAIHAATGVRLTERKRKR